MNKLFQNTVYITNLTRNEYDEIVEFLQLNGYTKNNSFSNYNNSIIGIYPYMCFTHINGNINSYVNESFKAITIKDLEKVGFRQNTKETKIVPQKGKVYFYSNPKWTYDYLEYYDLNGKFPYIHIDKSTGSGLGYDGSRYRNYSYDSQVATLIREATNNEIIWLNKCIELDKLISKEEILNSIKTINKEDLLEEAKRRYPIGTRFDNFNIYSWTGSRNKISDGIPYWENYKQQDEIRVCKNDGNMTIYKDGVWADIIEDVKSVELPIELLSLPEKWCIRFNNKEQYSWVLKEEKSWLEEQDEKFKEELNKTCEEALKTAPSFWAGMNVDGDVYYQKPETWIVVGGKQQPKQLEFQEPVIFKSKNKKNKLIII